MSGEAMGFGAIALCIIPILFVDYLVKEQERTWAQECAVITAVTCEYHTGCRVALTENRFASLQRLAVEGEQLCRKCNPQHDYCTDWR